MRHPAALRLLVAATVLAAVVVAPACRADESRVEILVDPRVELLSAAMTQGAWSPSLKGFFSPYAQEAQKVFFPHRADEAVKRLDALLARGLDMGSLFEWIVSLGPLPDLAPSAPPSTELAARAGGAEEMEALRRSLVGLARAVDFPAFIARSAKLDADLRATFRSRLPLPDQSIQQLENYTGLKHERYRILLAPLLGQTSFSWADALGKEADTLIAPSALKDGRLIFDPFITANSIYLGFGRLAAGAAVHSLPDRRDRHTDWYPYLAQKLQAAGIHDWSQTLVELFAGSVDSRLWAQQGRSLEVSDVDRRMAARGVVWMPFTVPRLSDYEQNREKYPTLKDFASRLYDALDELEPTFGGGEPGDLGLADVWLTEDGVPVKAVTPGSLGARAGIRKGDLIQSIAGVRINGSESYLKAWDRWEAAKNDEAVPFKIKRGRAVLTLKVVMKRAGKFQGFRKKAGP